MLCYMADYPSLALYFDTGKGLLKDARYIASSGGIADHRFCQAGSDDKLFVTELCIVILLAKLRGPNPDNPDQTIHFQEKSERPSWLKALGVAFSKNTHKLFFHQCFGEANFITGRRGGGHNKRKEKPEDEIYSFADYHPKEIRLANIHVYEYGDTKEIELDAPRLEKLLKKVEKSGVDAGYGWVSVIDEFIKEVKADRRRDSADEGRHVAASDTLEVKMSDPKNDLLLDISKQIERFQEKGTWYVLSSVPGYLHTWKEQFCGSILQRGSSVQFFHSMPLGSEREYIGGDGAAKLWEGNINESNKTDLKSTLADALKEMSKTVLKSQTKIKRVRKNRRIELALKEMPAWALKLKARLRKFRRAGFGSFEHNLTDVSLPYIAVLFVPTEKKKPVLLDGKAPKGAWCAISLCSIHPVSLGEHRALYLDRPSPLLDAYYTSIMRFFDEGKKRDFEFNDPLKHL
jgi:hypothetical protein